MVVLPVSFQSTFLRPGKLSAGSASGNAPAKALRTDASHIEAPEKAFYDDAQYHSPVLEIEIETNTKKGEIHFTVCIHIYFHRLYSCVGSSVLYRAFYSGICRWGDLLVHTLGCRGL